MAEEQVVITTPKSTVYIERSIQVRQYESLKVAIHYPVDFPIPPDELDSVEAKAAYRAQVDTAIKEAYYIAKAHVYEQAGLTFEDRDGVLIEKVAKTFEGAAEVVTQRPPSAPRPQRAVAAGQPKRCENCSGSDFYDNRSSKANGKYKANAPDFKCKQCNKGIWLEGASK